jgi:hypothetical protein
MSTAEGSREKARMEKAMLARALPFALILIIDCMFSPTGI